MISREGAFRFDVLDEQVRMTCVRLQVERASVRLRSEWMARVEATALIEQTKRQVAALFPDKAELFELLLRPRFERLYQERVLAEWGLGDSVN